MVDKLIRGKIFEIVIASLFIIISIPIWYNFDKKISNANITTLDDYNLTFKINNKNNNEELVVDNAYYLNKSYKIFLKINKDININKSSLTINGTKHSLNDFYREEFQGNYLYTIVSKDIIASTDTYDIKPDLIGNSIYYAYIFEENSNF